MGRYISKINNTYAEYGDYQWDYVKQNKPKEYYDKYTIPVEIEIEGTKQTVEVPLLELVDIKLAKKYYTWEWNDKKTLRRWLFNYCRNKGEKIECVISATLGTFNLNYDKPLIEGYYLQTDIGNEDIILSKEKKTHEIKNFEDFEWIRLRLLRAEF